MAVIRVKSVDVFTTSPLSGNSVGVVLEGDSLSGEQMQAIAKELNLSEVVFVCSPKPDDANVQVRAFTPTSEVTYGSHSLIALTHCLLEAKLLAKSATGNSYYTIKVASEKVTVEVDHQTPSPKIMLHFMPHFYEHATQHKADLVHLLNVTYADFESEFRMLRNSSLLVGIRRLHTVYTMKPNFAKITKYLDVIHLEGILVYTTETLDRDTSLHCRYFKSSNGAYEEPVTMLAYIPLSLYLIEKKYLKQDDNVCKFIAEQGDEIGRRGRIFGEVVFHDGKPEVVKLGGHAVTVMEGELLLPD